MAEDDLFSFDAVISLCRQLRTPVRTVRLAGMRVYGTAHYFSCDSRHWGIYDCWHSAGDAKEYQEPEQQEPYQSQHHGQNLTREAMQARL
jgi:hypothetical protein